MSETPPQDTSPPDDPADESQEQTSQSDSIPQDVVLEAALASLPPDILKALMNGARAQRSSSVSEGAGEDEISFARGRPLPSRKATPGAGKRIDLIATLRAAAPWQTIRRRMQPDTSRTGLLITMEDIHIRHFRRPRESAVIFVVDASGSAAATRLAEAKGAIELMLAEAYTRREHVALIAFRGTRADLLLPPTRSLVQAKRSLAGLPGGGGTPLANAVSAAQQLAETLRRGGRTPFIAFLTDGRGNISLTGTANRAEAAADTARMAQQLRASKIGTVLLDTSVRPRAEAATVAADMGARYLPLPRAGATEIADIVRGAYTP